MKAAIIGCGTIAKAHLAPVARMGVEVVGVCDLDEEHATSTAKAFGVDRTYRDAAELLHRLKPDVIHVLTPPQTHRDLAVQAMQAGSHVLVEKPMALDGDEADEMIEESLRSGRTLGVCHNLLFDHAVLEARQLARTGRLGSVAAMEIIQTPAEGERERCLRTGWIQSLPGGAAHELLPHLVYLLREFLGPLRVVSAVSRTDLGPRSPSLDFRAMLEGESGLGSAAISFSAGPRQNRVRIYGSEMTLDVSLPDHLLVKIRPVSFRRHARRALPNLDVGLQVLRRTFALALAELGHSWDRGHSELIRTFYEAVGDRRPPAVTAEDGRAVVSVLDQLWEALSPAKDLTL